MADRHLSLVLHDIAPETWPDYIDFVAKVDALARRHGPIPITWLVVPDFHHRSDCRRDGAFLENLQRRRAMGDELALHGYYHCDDAPSPRTPRDWFMRRFYTWEGEFYALDENEAAQRLDKGIELFRSQGWPLTGFVAPAWLMSQGARRALAQRDFCYTSDPQHLYTLPDYTRLEAPGLVWSARSAWRRGLSRLASETQRWRSREAPLLRLGLHPVDMRHARVQAYWLAVLERLIHEGRRPITKYDWVTGQRRREQHAA
ncbi:DUF2334 domain-containing protein [Chromohalobacter canadensis]|uniref:Polysaccharide deacetylase family protein n=1 Tax=Chromohalobacter canadensis TaxID=141389 RepID=A0ABZ0Y8Z1_9GAMM|nr:polysaccharide deacetylase family protein [Chromohalobacter canadensis]MCK0767968.1 polysaccharide deacetylase family protein [Chromohalobacter canadensis]MCT8467674.1 polysaccharide deacetylase family protein [Chromohalobacter canadensis]MCT8470578.1 polysaccharide deacetylase family protein [Chromohalobacter canadensis]MCT8498171.1 polysaccharide deacetylase family protein [Chromohalobacter canadensis]WQH08536.1 polysaccharide deacetylase family protein [Chromohalobacter canadensis]